eukprot:3504874-Amphidinium_carterae.1
MAVIHQCDHRNYESPKQIAQFKLLKEPTLLILAELNYNWLGMRPRSCEPLATTSEQLCKMSKKSRNRKPAKGACFTC